MKNIEQFNLIDGKFSRSDAKEILLKLINSKIQFHEEKIFSLNERFGQNDKNSIKRIPILLESKSKIEAFLNQLNDDTIIHIEADVKIAVK